MEFKAHRKQLLLAGPLATAVTAVMITACGGGSASALAQGSAPGHWTQTEISNFAATSGLDDGDSENSCIARYIEQDMSFGNAMAVDAASTSDIMSLAQARAVLVAKYGTAESDGIYSQYERVISDSVINCTG